MATPNTLMWIATRLLEEEPAVLIGLLKIWTHLSKIKEATHQRVQEMNRMLDREVVIKLDDMQQPKYVKLAGDVGKLTMGIQLSTPGHPEKINVAALLDSGCDGSSIDHRFILRNKIPTRQVQNPMKVTNADGMENKHGMIKEYVILRVQIDEHVEELEFAVTQLNSMNIFLGLDWLRHHNPLVNWNIGQLWFENCLKECQQSTVK